MKLDQDLKTVANGIPNLRDDAQVSDQGVARPLHRGFLRRTGLEVLQGATVTDIARRYGVSERRRIGGPRRYADHACFGSRFRVYDTLT